MKPDVAYNFTNFTSFSNMSLTPVPVLIKTIDLDSTVVFYGGPGEKRKELDAMLAAVDTVRSAHTNAAPNPTSTAAQCLTHTVTHAALTHIHAMLDAHCQSCCPHGRHALDYSPDIVSILPSLPASLTLSSTVAARGCRGVPRRRGQMERSFGRARKGDGAGGPGSSGAGVAQGRGPPQSMADQCSSRRHTTDVARGLLQGGMGNSWLCLYQFNDPTTVSAKRSRIKVCSELVST
jgi:hypothetical protein